MECPYFKASMKGSVCKAAINIFTPCAEEAVNYCATEEHYRCPILLAHVLRGGNGNTVSCLAY